MQKSFKHLGGSFSTFCTLSVIHRVRSSDKHKHRYDVAGLLLNYRIYLSRLIHTIIIFSIYITCVRVENTLYLVCGDIPFKCLKTMPYQTMEDTPPPTQPPHNRTYSCSPSLPHHKLTFGKALPCLKVGIEGKLNKIAIKQSHQRNITSTSHQPPVSLYRTESKQKQQIW